MKIVCHRESFLSAVSIAAAVASPRSPRPVLSCVSLRADDKDAWALATDLEVSVRARLPEVIVEEPGGAVLPAVTLVDILKSIESAEVRLSSDGRKCEIQSDDAEYELVTEDPDEFPEIPALGHQGIVVPRSFLEEMVQRTAFAVAREPGRYAVHGVQVSFRDGEMRLAGTDGRRLAVARRAVPEAPEGASSTLVPPKALIECLRGSEREENVRVALTENRITLASDSVEVSARPIEGEYPEYERILPTDFGGRARLDRDAFLSALRKVAILAGREIRAVRLTFGEDSLELSAQVEGRGKGETRVAADIEGEGGFSASYNPDYIVDFVKALPSGRVLFEYREPSASAQLRHEESGDLYVVMPITTT